MNRAATKVLAADLSSDLVLAHKILYRHGVLDAWGHVSVRDPMRADSFWMAKAMPPAFVESDHLVQLDLDGCVVDGPTEDLFLERFIHAAVYAARPDVGSVLHSHSPGMVVFGVSDTPLTPLTQVAGFLGQGAPVFEIRDVDGGDDFLISTMSLGRAMSERLGAANAVLLRGHGWVSVATSIRQVVWRGIYGELNANQQLAAARLGSVRTLSSDEAAFAARNTPPDRNRAWDLWVHEVRTSSHTREPI